MPVDLEILTRPFPKEALKTREGGGNKRLTYVEGHTVIRRLNEACGAEGWSFQIMREWSEDAAGGTLLKALVELTLPGLGSRQHIGVQKLRGNDGEDIHKGAVTDGLKKAATLFGVGLELYGPDYEGEDAPAVQVQRAQPAQERFANPSGPMLTGRSVPPAQAESSGDRGALLPNGSPREQVASGAFDTSPPEGMKAQPGVLSCSEPECGKVLTRGQHDVSLRAFGQPLCPEHQKLRREVAQR